MPRRSDVPVLVFAVLALVGALALFAAAKPAGAEARAPLQVGIADDAALFGDPAAADDAVAAWKRNGVDTVRIQVSWGRVAPDPQSPDKPADFNAGDPSDPQYHWDRIDAAVDRVVGAGLTPILMIDGPPPLWASATTAEYNPRSRPRATEFGPFATAVAKRYGDRVDTYILWNEPNLPLWLQPQANCGGRTKGQHCDPISPNLYRQMVRQAYQPMHDADPVATVLIGALAPAGSNLTSRDANMRPLEFLRGLGCVDAKLHPITTGGCSSFQPAVADGIAYHPHSTRNAPDQAYANPDDADLASLSRVEQLADQLQQRGRLWGSTTPLNFWLDEYGYQTNPPDKARGVSNVRQDRYLQQAAYIAWRDPRVQLITQYLWKDEKVGGGRKYTGWQSGLIAADGRLKPALAHFDDPMWIDLPRSTIWGQVRRGGAHLVAIQQRLPGTLSDWSPIAEAGTADDGSWSVQTALVPYASYRAVADDGQITATMVAAPPSASELDSGQATQELTAAGIPVERRAASTQPGLPVPSSFAGFSVEYWSALDYLGNLGQPNPIFAELVRTLGATGNGSPTIRIGGNSTDATWWNPDGSTPPPGVGQQLAQPFVDQLRAWQQATKTPMVLGVNLGVNDPAHAASYVQAAVTTIGTPGISGLEIGNEPDRYTQTRTFHVGQRSVGRVERRPLDWGFDQYAQELHQYVDALTPIAGGVPLSGGAFAGSVWDLQQDELLQREGTGMRAFGAHTYALEGCGAAARSRTKRSYVRALLGPGGFQPIVARMGQLGSVARAYGADLRVSEANTANCGGANGSSNAFASALWGADLLFGLAEVGVKNVDFHMWNGAFYSPVDFVHSKGRLVARVHPLYYGMLLFDRAMRPGARLLPISRNGPNASLKTWGTIDPAGTRRIVIINKDSATARQVVLRIPGGGASARIERLTAPSVLEKVKVSFAGQTFGRVTRDGKLQGKKVVERLARRGGTFRIPMDAGSAALVTIPAAPALGAPAPPAAPAP